MAEVDALIAEAERVEAQERSGDPIDQGRFTSLMESATMVRNIIEARGQS